MQSESSLFFSTLSVTEEELTMNGDEAVQFIRKKRRKPKNRSKALKKEEEKLLKYALQLSEKEYMQKQELEQSAENAKAFRDIEPFPVFHATEMDFKNPINYFDEVWDENEQTSGAIKIIPPQKWKQKHKDLFNLVYRTKICENDKKLFTRIQKLNTLYKAKKFEHARIWEFDEFREMGGKIFKEIYKEDDRYEGKWLKKRPTVEKIEEDYWDACQEGSEEITVHFAADVEMNKYFPKSEISTMINEDSQSNFTLVTINTMKNSLMQFIKKSDSAQISGISIPWFYFGMLYSTLCWHTEDMYLYCLHYLHEGAPKVWYSISHQDKEKMDEYIRGKYYAILLKKPDLIHQLTVHISPLELIRNGIKVYRTVQYQGEMILTLPKGYHFGVSTGLDISESVNFSVKIK